MNPDKPDVEAHLKEDVKDSANHTGEDRAFPAGDPPQDPDSPKEGHDEVSELRTPGAAIFLHEIQAMRSDLSRIASQTMALNYLGAILVMGALYIVARKVLASGSTSVGG